MRSETKRIVDEFTRQVDSQPWRSNWDSQRESMNAELRAIPAMKRRCIGDGRAAWTYSDVVTGVNADAYCDACKRRLIELGVFSNASGWSRR